MEKYSASQSRLAIVHPQIITPFFKELVCSLEAQSGTIVTLLGNLSADNIESGIGFAHDMEFIDDDLGVWKCLLNGSAIPRPHINGAMGDPFFVWQ